MLNGVNMPVDDVSIALVNFHFRSTFDKIFYFFGQCQLKNANVPEYCLEDH